MSTQRRSPMRLIVTLLLLITGGAIVNVAVAWGCAAVPLSSKFNILNVPFTDRAFSQQPTERWRPTHWGVRRHEWFGGVRVVVAAIMLPSRTTDASFESLLPDVDGFAENLDERELFQSTDGDWGGLFLWDACGWPTSTLSSHWPWFQPTSWPRPPDQ